MGMQAGLPMNQYMPGYYPMDPNALYGLQMGMGVSYPNQFYPVGKKIKR